MKTKILSLVFLPLLLAGCSLSGGSSSSSAGSLWKSTDSGKTWVLKNKSALNEKIDFAGMDVLNLAIDLSNANVVYAGLRTGGIIKTEDGGETWKHINFQSEKVYGLELDPVNSKIVYTTAVWQGRGKVFKSTDGGDSWQEIYTSPSNGPLAVSLTLDKRNPSSIYITTSDNQVIETTDYGVTWKNIFQTPSPVLKIVIDKINSSLLYLVTQTGVVFRSKDAGKSWEDLSKFIAKTSFNHGQISFVETDPNNGNWLYAAGAAGILRSKDAGENWEVIPTLGNSSTFPVTVVAINPTNSNEIIYGSAQAAYRSVDGGSNWSTFQFPSGKSMRIIKYSSADPSILYAGNSK